jgi:hypothetical protein
MSTSASAATDATAQQEFKQRIETALEGVSYPAHPPVLIETAERSGAARDVVDALRVLPDEAFGSFSEVAASIEGARTPVGSTNRDCAS